MHKYVEIIENDEIIKKIKPYLNNIQTYLIGGFVRDILMGEKSPDRDLIVCNCDVKEFSKNLADKLNAYFIELDSINKIYRIVFEDKINYLDITCPIENNLEKDIKRRDLTINAIAYNLNDSKFIDLVNGMSDIQNKKIKGISFENFEDDPLRILRIYRFYSKTGFQIDEELINTTKTLLKRINEPAKERITTELLKMFEGEYCDKALLKLEETGLLYEIFPIYNDVKKIPPNTHHHLDLTHHLIETVNQIQINYKNSNEEIRNYLDTYVYGSVKRIAFLKLASFLHDIGKPSCWTIEEDTQRHRFIKHDEIGSKLVVPILKELKFSKKQIEYIQTLIKYHIYPSSLISAPDVNEKAYMKFYRKMDGFVIDVIFLAMADRLSARGIKVTDEMVKNNIENLTKLLNNYLTMKKDIKPLEKLLDGNDIMEILGIKQSPQLGIIVKQLKEAQLNGDVTTKKEAIDFVNTYYTKRG